MTPVVLESALGGAALLVTAGVGSLFLRRGSPELRHLAWTVALGAAAAFPLARLVPDWLPVALPAEGAAVAAATWLTPIWLAGVVGVLALAAAEGLALRAIRARSAPVREPRVLRAFDRAIVEVGVTPRPVLLEGPPGGTPKTWGAWRAFVVLPPESRAWSDERLRVVLLHELVHLRRRDWLSQWVATAACALHWFNPLAWRAAGRLRDERERACDAAVLRQGVSRSAYAEALLDFARRGVRISSAIAPLTGGSGRTLVGRVATILERGEHTSPPSARSRFGITAGALAACLALAGVGVSHAPDEGPAAATLIAYADDWSDAGGAAAFESAIGTLCSRDQRRVFAAVLARSDLGPADRAAVLRAAAVIDRSADLSALLVDFAAKAPVEGDVRAAYIETSRAIDLDRERARAIAALRSARSALVPPSAT